MKAAQGGYVETVSAAGSRQPKGVTLMKSFKAAQGILASVAPLMKSFKAPSFLQAPQDAQIQQQIAQLKQQVNGEHVKMMVTLQQNTCFKKCVTSPSSSLSRGEQESIANSVDRFSESFDFVTSTFLSAQQGGR